MKLHNLIHVVIGIVGVGFLPNAQPVAAQSRRVDRSPLASVGDVQEAWIDRYDGPGNYDDEARAVAVDGSGNVYVTGFSFDPNTDYDYTTIKYNSAGRRQWIARYDGPENSTDQATAIAVDASGNVYITGASSSNAGGLDYATVKYNSAGQQQWVTRYDGPANSTDQATAIALDASGNVYITGASSSYVGVGNLHYATVKYNSAGQQQWAARYNGPANYTDEPTAIAVDGSGSVYVTGGSAGAAFYDDYATVKYNSAGQQQWVARYDGPANSDDQATAMAIDGVGNIYVTGYSLGSVGYDYATIKYNSTGQQQWVRRYDGTGHDWDRADAIAVDNKGFVYVTGNSLGSDGGDDYATIKYDSAGQQQWIARYEGPAGFDYPNAIALDGLGNIYVTGGSLGSGTAQDYATIKYNSTGQQQWVARYDGPGDSDDVAMGIAVDGSGNVYVTGSSYNSGTYQDYATIKYVQGARPSPTPRPMPNPRPRPTPAPRPSP